MNLDFLEIEDKYKPQLLIIEAKSLLSDELQFKIDDLYKISFNKHEVSLYKNLYIGLYELKVYRNTYLKTHAYTTNNILQFRGAYTKFYPDGKLRELKYYNDDGVCSGEYKEWYSNGQIKKHCFKTRLGDEGEYKTWYANGKIDEHVFIHRGQYYSIEWGKENFPKGLWI